MIEFVVTIPFEDYTAAGLLFQKTRRQRRILYFSLGALVLFLCGTDLLDALSADHIDWTKLAVSLVVALFIAGVTLVAVRYLPHVVLGPLMRRTYAQIQFEGAPLTYGFDANGMTLTMPQSHASLNWPQLYGWIEDERHLLLLRTERSYFIVPKAQVDPAMLAQFRAAIIAAAVPTR